MKAVRIWESEKKNFGPLSEIEVLGGRVKSIQPSTSKEAPKFLLPGFCDASVTLGSNSLGGRTAPAELTSVLRGFLSAGFSHILSTGDPDLGSLQNEISKQKWPSPILLQAQKPLVKVELPPGGETLYNRGSSLASDPKRMRIQPLFLKETSGVGFTQTELFSAIQDLKSSGSEPIAYTFADPTNWEDALDTGFRTVFHPMPETTRLSRIQTRGFRWAPMLSTLYLAEIRNEQEKRNKLAEVLTKHHPYFAEKWKERLLTMEPNPNGQEPLAFSEAFRVFGERSQNVELIFASGSGHFGLFPGTAGVLEVLLWDLAMQKEKDSKEDLKKSLPWFQRILSFFSPKEPILLSPKQDPSSLPSVRREILAALTTNTCVFLGADHNGKISVGGPAHFSIHAENPLFRDSGIFPIESMVIGGKLVYTPKPSKAGTAL